MPLVRQMMIFGRHLIIAGIWTMVMGLAVFGIEIGLGNSELRLERIGLLLGAAAGLGGAVVLYQQQVYWKKMALRLRKAPVVTNQDKGDAPRIPWWFIAFAAITVFSCAYSLGGAVGLLGGGMLLGYGISTRRLAPKVAELEHGAFTYYSRRDPQTRRPEIVRVVADVEE